MGTALNWESMAHVAILSPDASRLKFVMGTADPDWECKAQRLISSPDTVLNMVHPHPEGIEPIDDCDPIGRPNIASA
jgi:hypothetical protein